MIFGVVKVRVPPPPPPDPVPTVNVTGIVVAVPELGETVIVPLSVVLEKPIALAITVSVALAPADTVFVFANAVNQLFAGLVETVKVTGVALLVESVMLPWVPLPLVAERGKVVGDTVIVPPPPPPPPEVPLVYVTLKVMSLTPVAGAVA